MELDVSKKVRTAIKAKLLELGVHVDEELPDYIMILVANRRSKEQMVEDLSLFLGDNTLKFTGWLNQVLRKLQEVTTSAPPKPPPVAVAPKPTEEIGVSSVVKRGEAKEPAVTSSAPQFTEEQLTQQSTEDKNSTKRRKAEIDSSKASAAVDDGIKSPITKKLRITRQPVESPHKSSDVSLTKRLSSQDKEDKPKKPEPSIKPFKLETAMTRRENVKETPPVKVASVLSKIMITNKASAISSKKSESGRLPVKSEISLSDRKSGRHSPIIVPAATKRRHSLSQKERSASPELKRNIKSTKLSRTRSKSKSRSRSSSPVSRARKSLRSLVAVVKRHNELNALKDEEYNPQRPEVTNALSSVIHVTPRPKRVAKQEAGSNKLLFRALADAQKSIASHAATSKAQIEKEKNDTLPVIAKETAQEPKKVKSQRSKTISADGDKRSRKSEQALKKPSIKDRLGYRLGSKIIASRSSEGASPFEDLESEELEDDEYLLSGDENYKSIIVNVPTTKDSKERNVTLDDYKSRPSPVATTEEPKRLSIQVNVDSDDTSTSEDELEIQPGPTEDLNLDPQDEPGKPEPSKIKKKDSDSEEDSGQTGDTKETIRKEDSKLVTSSTSSSPRAVEKRSEVSSKELPQDESSKQSDELEIEEYEEIVEEEDDEEYEVVIQERNTALPDPGEFGDLSKVTRNNSEVMDVSTSEVDTTSMEVTDGNSVEYTLSNSPTDYMEDTSTEYTLDNVRQPLNMRSLNHSDTKFVVTMDGDENYEELMKMETSTTRSTEGDLRNRITRSIIPPKPPTFSSASSQSYNVPNPYLPTTGAPRAFQPTSTSAASAASVCKYWPECSFKDKCVYPHPKCKYGENCTKPHCPYKHSQSFGNGTTDSHQSTAAVGGSENDGKILCKFFPKCHSMSCSFYHPSPCRFGLGCTDVKCKSFHPGQTVGQQRSKNKMYGAAAGRSAYRAPPPAAHLLRWKAPAAPIGEADSKVTDLNVV